MMYTCGLLTISDTCSSKNYKDVSGEVLLQEIKLLQQFNILKRKIVADDEDVIKETIIDWCDNNNVNLIITTGGTGFSPTDVTPEATTNVIDRPAYSLSHYILTESLKTTMFAALSRGICGIRKNSLIINLPGSPKAVKECLCVIAPILPHALDQIAGKKHSTDTYRNMQHSKIITSVTVNDLSISHRPRASTFSMVTVENAGEMIHLKAFQMPSVRIDISESLNMVVSNNVVSKVNVPPFCASIKDGYAVSYEDGNGLRSVKSSITAGEFASTSVTKGTCVRISTGAPVPPGADAVVQIEDTELLENNDLGEESVINIKVSPKYIGQDIRQSGSDLKVGDVILPAGTVIGPAEIGALAMGGVPYVDCVRRPVVGVISTGNELVSYTENIGPTDVVDCNRPMLIALFKSCKCKVIDFGIVEDKPQSIMNTLLESFQNCDVVVSTGGLSMGEKDYMKLVLTKDLNAEIHFGRVLMKPGKPTTFATVCDFCTDNKVKLIFCLPGNPVSSYVTAHLFVIPALKKMAGFTDYKFPIVEAKLKHDIELDERPEFRRCKVFTVTTKPGIMSYEVSSEEFGNQISSRLISCVAANGLICLEPAKSTESNILLKDTMVSVMLLN